MGDLQRRLVQSPLGDLMLVAEGGRLVELRLPGEKSEAPAAWAHEAAPQAQERPAVLGHEAADRPAPDEVLGRATEQLEDYFAGRLTVFDLPLQLRGTAFQRRVWETLLQIGYGDTLSYAALASLVERPGAARAVGRAVGQNPIAIVVPCHRVIGSDGSLTGYGGGLPAKHSLLQLEGVLLPS